MKSSMTWSAPAAWVKAISVVFLVAQAGCFRSLPKPNPNVACETSDQCPSGYYCKSPGKTCCLPGDLVCGGNTDGSTKDGNVQSGDLANLEITSNGGTGGGGTGAGGAGGGGATGGGSGGVEAVDGPGNADVPSTDDAPTDAGLTDTVPTTKTIGDPCTLGKECASGFCADKVCCNEACDGQCAACDGTTKGTCLVVTGAPHGTRAACSGTGACAGACDGKDTAACHYPGAAVTCAPSSCSAGVATPAATCDGKGGCATPTTVSCSPAPCNGTTCGQCSATNPCSNGFQCDTGLCVPKLDPGQRCGSPDQCKSGFCQQDVCCDRTCSGACESCNQSGHAGTCTFLSGNACRPSAGACDQAETCSGAGSDCPADGKKPAGTECRAASGACDVAESCDGSSVNCPNDAKKPNGTECRAVAGVCDVAESCDGFATDCPPDLKKSSSNVCRPSADLCDKPESCDGQNNACPPDLKASSGTLCRAAADVCDLADTCDGQNNACPDLKASKSTVCRASAGVCDVADTCDGQNNACPPDARQPTSTVCRAASSTCDVAEYCTGAVDCPADGFKSSATSCGNSLGDCATVPHCSGTSASCLSSVPITDGRTCRASTGLSDPAELCTGSADTCPTDVKYVNRISNPEFDSGTADWTTPLSTTFSVDSGSAISGTYSAKMAIPQGNYLQLNQNLAYVFPSFTYHVAFLAKASVPVSITVGIGDLLKTVNITTSIQQFGPYDFQSGAGGVMLQFQSLEESAASPFTVWIDRVEVYSELDQ